LQIAVVFTKNYLSTPLKNRNLKFVKYLAWGVGAYGALWLYQRYVLSKNVEITISNFKINGNILNPQLEIVFQVSNPTNVSVVFESFSGNVFNDSGESIANLSTLGSQRIEKYQYTFVPIIARTTLNSILNSITSFYATKNASYKIVGTAVVDGIKIPFSTKYDF
jgi:hypothetical protein